MTRLGAVLVLAATGLSGCGLINRLPERTPDPVPIAVSYRAPTVDGHRVRRVVVLPFVETTGDQEATAIVRQALVDALHDRELFDVVVADEDSLTEREERDIFLSGVVQQQTLLRVAKHYGADAVLYGVVNRWKPYEPLALGMRIELVSAGAGDSVWSASAMFDAQDMDTQRDAHNYMDREQRPEDSLVGWRLVLLSPRRFASYACSRLAATW